MRPIVHDYGFSVVSPQTNEAQLVEWVEAHSDSGSFGADDIKVWSSFMACKATH
jgi:hypothetical protein